MKKTLLLSLSVILAVLVSATVAQAIGTLTPLGTAGDDTQYSLNDIWTKLTTGVDGTEGSGTMTVPGTQTASFYTLSDIYSAIPEWLELSDTTTTVSAGYYESTDLATVDTDLVAGNIANGIDIFGITGTVIEGTPELEWSDEQGSMNWADAGTACDNLAPAGDWRLPAIDELVAAFADEWILGGEVRFAFDTDHWSSSEDSASIAWSAYWADNVVGSYADKSMSFSVRCVR